MLQYFVAQSNDSLDQARNCAFAPPTAPSCKRQWRPPKAKRWEGFPCAVPRWGLGWQGRASALFALYEYLHTDFQARPRKPFSGAATANLFDVISVCLLVRCANLADAQRYNGRFAGSSGG